jgi:hypothetical protein
MKSYKFTFPSETNFRQYTVYQEVEDLDPDGFSADAATGDDIIEDIAANNDLVIADQWDTYGQDGAERLLVWESEEDADNDDGANAICQIIRKAI